MGQSFDQILATVADGATVNVVIASNQDNGTVGYGVGSLVFHQEIIEVVTGRIVVRARLSSTPDQPLKLLISDRLRDVDTRPDTPDHDFGRRAPRQPFNVDAAESDVRMSIVQGDAAHQMTLAFFGGELSFSVTALGNTLVGLGPSLGGSAGAGAWVVAFPGIAHGL